MPEPLIAVAISGYAGSGKDTLADYWIREYGFQKLSFAARLKKMLELAGFSKESLYGPSEKRELPNKRYIFSGVSPQTGQPLEQLTDNPDDPEYWRDPATGETYGYYVTTRLAAQTLGTEWGRRLCRNMWADIGAAQALDLYDAGEGSFFVYTDTRFRNELDATRGIGGFTLRLKRGRPLSTHPSELEMSEIPDSEFDYVIENDRDLDHLYREGDRIIKDILKQRRIDL